MPPSLTHFVNRLISPRNQGPENWGGGGLRGRRDRFQSILHAFRPIMDGPTSILANTGRCCSVRHAVRIQAAMHKGSKHTWGKAASKSLVRFWPEQACRGWWGKARVNSETHLSLPARAFPPPTTWRSFDAESTRRSSAVFQTWNPRGKLAFDSILSDTN